MASHIVLVDDDVNITTSVSMRLEAEGFRVTAYNDSEQAVAKILDLPPDLVVLDIKMPRLDGREVLKKIREKLNVPVIFLTSMDDEIDQFLGLRLGADDYMTKPFSQRLLIERIRTILRRESRYKDDAKSGNGEEGGASDETLQSGHLKLDMDRQFCYWKDTRVDMTVTEFLLVACLTRKPGHVKSREQLMDFAYGDDVYVDDRTVDSHIKRIRKKFKAYDDSFNHIETVYGTGYRLKEG